ncbi:F-box-like/WD repeat-containing protein TBL1XR1 like [Verticillium longisporum]|uniref:F-box-like/WD repeat-containing protein TBL1XR1 like n=1 Tax=Verticillium longisporum TaxID=100787 RepID=A0A8I2Z1E7_VERLO|nr:F-box-like/WD repeat-containing protein TBL1XR1 like [Verticillium longisporum]
MKEYLDSDRVNYLVWRYLLEGNYRETAAKFQKEWHAEPHLSQIAWNSVGSAIAVAIDHEGKTSVQVRGTDGSQLGKFDVTESPVIKLRWNPTDTALLGIAPENGGALISVFQPLTSTTLTYFLPDHDIDNWPLDAAWTSEATILLCGGQVLVSLRCTDTAIVVDKKIETQPDDNFSQVQFDTRSNLAATASASGVLDLWNEAGERHAISAHSGAITALQWQPVPKDAHVPDDERLIASGGDDCAILIWNARKPDQKAKCFLTMDSPIVRLAFTPDGAFIAGATAGRILIWKVGDTAIPRASWSRTPHLGWLSPKTTTESEDEDEHCLGWDCDGRRLAYGANSRLAVINFRR